MHNRQRGRGRPSQAPGLCSERVRADELANGERFLGERARRRHQTAGRDSQPIERLAAQPHFDYLSIHRARCQPIAGDSLQPMIGRFDERALATSGLDLPAPASASLEDSELLVAEGEGGFFFDPSLPTPALGIFRRGREQRAAAPVDLTVQILGVIGPVAKHDAAIELLGQHGR